MPYLSSNQYSLAQPFFETFDRFHLCVQAVLKGTAPGQVWVDDIEQPRAAFVSGQEGCYLGGDPGYQGAFADLREVIPQYAYLLVDPPGWEGVLGRVWRNIAARRHARQHFVFRQETAPAWRSRLPDGMQVVPVDAAFFSLDTLENHDAVMDWVDGWHSREYFLAHGIGTCLVDGDKIASWSLMDVALDERCEIGVHTAIPYRRQGLGSLVVAATIETCLARGFREIGWQCLSSNAGSIGVAMRTGFVKERDYLAFSNWMPAESAGDLTCAEYEDWALHYVRASQAEPGWAFLAAQAWALSGNTSQALASLHVLKDSGWRGQREWFEDNWWFNGLRCLPEFKDLTAALVEGV
jgi:RimJ/RimL family protein N-acetyltransferase